MIPHKWCEQRDGKVLIQDVDTLKYHTLNCTKEQYLDGYKAYYDGALVQDAFPFLNDNDREFLISGTTAKEWDAMWLDSRENGDDNG